MGAVPMSFIIVAIRILELVSEPDDATPWNVLHLRPKNSQFLGVR